jgi:DNA-binding response OmpR family regulator
VQQDRILLHCRLWCKLGILSHFLYILTILVYHYKHLLFISSFQESLMHLSDIQWLSDLHAIKAGHTLIPLTKTEFRLLFPLRSGTPLTYAQLAWIAFQSPLDRSVRSLLDKHFDRIRTKLRGSGFYVYCVKGYGYLLLPEPAL